MEICCIQQFLQKVRQDYQDGHQFISGPKDVIVMNNDKIVLQLQKGEFAPIGNTVKDGWKITPLTKMEVRIFFYPTYLSPYVTIMDAGVQERADDIKSHRIIVTMLPATQLDKGERA